ncbi:MAG: hypothetical protein RLZZ70_601 [Candidatus Parcubacteria bacterium]|jgi:hypothetical protein
MFWFHKKADVEDMHIRILREALAREAFTVAEMSERLKLNQEQLAFLNEELHHTSPFFKLVGGGNVSGYKYMLSLEGRSRLLEYDELKEARENAYKASVMAMWALIVSGAGVVISFVGVLVQLFCS